jgi:hypothetical protein
MGQDVLAWSAGVHSWPREQMSFLDMTPPFAQQVRVIIHGSQITQMSEIAWSIG